MTNRLGWGRASLLTALLAVAATATVAEARGVTTAAGRPLHLHVPPSYTGTTAVPLVILLHGATKTSDLQELYMRVGEQADLHGFLYAYPDGLRGPLGQFWNGAWCCQPNGTAPVDDVKYIDEIINYVRVNYRLDERKIFIIGHSNGSFMASRYACESNQVAAIVTLGGGGYKNRFDCGTTWYPPFLPLPGMGTAAVLHIHGTADLISPYWYSWLPTLPSAPETIGSWQFRNGCGLFASSTPPPIDLDPGQPGPETTKEVFTCAGPALEFWTMNGSPHIPNFRQSPSNATFAAFAVEWLLAHGR